MYLRAAAETNVGDVFLQILDLKERLSPQTKAPFCLNTYSNATLQSNKRPIHCDHNYVTA